MVERRRAPITTVAQVRAAEVGRNKITGAKGLYLDVKPSGKRYFSLCIMLDGKRIERGLGAFPDVGLAEAKDKATLLAAKIRGGEDTGGRRGNRQDVSDGPLTFRQAAKMVMANREAGWKSAVHANQWVQTLRDYVYPMIGDMPVADITVRHIAEVLRPLWVTKHETARNVKSRIGMVLDLAVAMGFRDDNPARMSVVRTFGTTRGVD